MASHHSADGRDKTAGGMPPFSPLLNDADAAAVVSYVRSAWGNAVPAVTAAQVNRDRAVPLD